MTNAHLFRFPDGYPDTLEQMGQVVGRTLMRKGGMKAERAQEAAFAVVEAIRHEFGGSPIYINKGTSFDLQPRDEEIWRKFNGHNYTELAREYKLTEVRVREIVNIARARDTATRQGQLPL